MIEKGGGWPSFSICMQRSLKEEEKNDLLIDSFYLEE